MLPSARSTYTVPQDVINEIITHISTDKISLRACSLASYSFLQPAREHLFSEIKIYNGTLCASLFSTIQKNRHLASYIRSLQIIPIAVYGDLAFSWLVTRSETTVSLLHFLRDHLRSFSYVDSWMNPQPFTIFSSELQSAFFALFSAPNLVDISLKSWKGFPVAFFAGCSQLKRLQLSMRKMSGEIVPAPALAQSGLTEAKGKLDILEVNSDGTGRALLEAMIQPQSRLGIWSLRDVTILKSLEPTEAIWGLLLPAASSICSLSFSMTDSTPVDTCPKYLGQMISLKRLIITYECDVGSEEPDNLLPWLVPSLACITAPSPLEELTLELITQFDASDLDPLCDSVLWSSLDRIISSAAYPQFSILKVLLTVNSSAGGASEMEIEAMIASQMTSDTSFLHIVVLLEEEKEYESDINYDLLDAMDDTNVADDILDAVNDAEVADDSDDFNYSDGFYD